MQQVQLTQPGYADQQLLKPTLAVRSVASSISRLCRASVSFIALSCCWCRAASCCSLTLSLLLLSACDGDSSGEAGQQRLG